MNEQYLTTGEAAQRLGVTRARVLQYISKGRLPAHKRGRDLWIDPRDLAAFERRPTGRPAKKVL